MRISRIILLLLITINCYSQKTITWYRITADSNELNYNPFQVGNTIKTSYYNINPTTGEQYKYNGNGTWTKDSLFFSANTFTNGVAWVNTWIEFTSALSNENVRSINLTANLTATTKAFIPKNQSTIKEINGHGFEITIPSNIDTGFVRTFPSLSSAMAGIDQQLRFTNLSLKGAGNNNCMYISANYGMKFEGCRFTNFKIALDLRWCMDAVIDQCFFRENYIGINLDFDKFSGGSNSTSCSNHPKIENCKFRNSIGDFANIKINACSGAMIIHNIFEGTLNGGDYDVYFDDNGSTVVKEVTMYGNHVEHIPAIASFYIKLKDGYANCGGIYSQYDCTLIKFESSAYAKCFVTEIPYLTNGTKFENVNLNGRWWFLNVPATFDPYNINSWVGTVPINTRIDNWNTNGQSPYIQLGTKKL
jgi:hypothetical protein